MRRLLFAVLMFSLPAVAVSVRPPRVRVHHKDHSRLTAKQKLRHPFWHPMFPPTHESLIRQNAEIDRLALPRMYTQGDIADAVQQGALVPLPLGSHLTVDPRLPTNRRYCRPWTAKFLTDLSDAFYERFKIPLQVNSAVRTVDFQKKLRRYNRNAAPSEGEAASSHLAGLTVDLERKRLNKTQVRFIGLRLLYLRSLGMVEVEEEYYQLCFHVMVSGKYGPPQVETQAVELSITPFEEPDADRTGSDQAAIDPNRPN